MFFGVFWGGCHAISLGGVDLEGADGVGGKFERESGRCAGAGRRCALRLDVLIAAFVGVRGPDRDLCCVQSDWRGTSTGTASRGKDGREIVGGVLGGAILGGDQCQAAGRPVERRNRVAIVGADDGVARPDVTRVLRQYLRCGGEPDPDAKSAHDKSR